MAKLISITEKGTPTSVKDDEAVQRVPLTENQVLDFADCDIVKVTYKVTTENEKGEKETKEVPTHVVVFANGFRCSLSKLTKNFVNGKVEKTAIGDRVTAITKKGVLDALHGFKNKWVVASINKDNEGNVTHEFVEQM